MRETKCNKIKVINQEAENRKRRRRLTTKRLIYLLK